ncbi:MAG TPA: aldehyde dehydrogenase family protein [Candidatus Polarisedimenticolaceae bacterium]|nr:aldehyde dehydrogenase family protein [Candidatus Polarisedimenticolaceae bacterium]
MLHVPVVRAGRSYRSLDRVTLTHVRTSEPVVEVSQANAGLIARDLLRVGEHRRRLQAIGVEPLLDICRRAAESFIDGELPVDVDSGSTLGPEAFVELQSATTGMPQALCRANMEKVRFVLAEMPRVLGGLSRGLDLRALDDGWVEQNGRPVSYLCQTDALGAVLPSNSPGVHALWIPAIPLKVPLVLKPGREEPWTPLRIMHSLIAAGCPAEALSFYPTDHAGTSQILLRCQRSMFFGDATTVAAWQGEDRIQLHGPGWSKVVLGPDKVDSWPQYIELMTTSIAANGGRSCVNASGVWVPAHGRAIADALAARLASIEPRPLDDPQAELAAFTRPEMARAVSDYIDDLLAQGGAEDVTAAHRRGGRVIEVDGCTFLLPTLIHCSDPDHPLARTELLFPFAAVVEVPPAELLDRIGSTLVVSAVTDDPRFRRELLTSRNVERLNLGPLPTGVVSWDQPHEGNLFEHLYRQRAFQAADPAA